MKEDPLGKKLAFIYNLRHKYPDPKNIATFKETDFDDKATIDCFTNHLQKIGFEVLPIESDVNAENTLIREKSNIAFVLNYSEEVVGSVPKIYMAEVLERIGLPFSGCTNKVQRLIINKGKMKEVLLAKNVPTLPFQVIDDVNEKLSEKLSFPVIVKPIARGSSAGITNKSVVSNDEEFSNQVKFILDTFSEPAIIEPFIEGREFSIGMLGNPPELFPIIEPLHDKLPGNFQPIDSLEVKWEFEEQVVESYFSCPAKVDEKLKEEIEKICFATWHALEIRDFCRIDLRMDASGQLYVLDVNSPPGIIPPEVTATSYFAMAARVKGYSYEMLLEKIIAAGMKRYKSPSLASRNFQTL